MAEQLAFDLPAHVQLGPQDFFVTEANAAAFHLIGAPSSWPDGKLVLVGPPGSGKTHLAGLFAADAGATLLSARSVDPAAALPDGPLVLEDAEALAEDAEEWVFHAYNHLTTQGASLLITGAHAPSRWPTALPDLRSRFEAITLVDIKQPDDPLLTAVLLKHFSDRQLKPSPDAVTYLQTRLPRSFEAVARTVYELDKASLAAGKALTRPFVARVLDSLRTDAR